MTKIINVLTDDKIQVNIIDAYNKAIKDSVDPLKTMAEYAGKANTATAQLIKSSNGAIIVETEKAKALTKSAKSTKLATAGMKALAVAGNMLLNIGISAAISLLITGIDKLVNYSKNLKKAASVLTDTLSNFQAETKENLQTIDELSDKYEKYRKGVDALGRNVKLTNEEYDEYLDICDKLANIMPDMVSYYNNEKQAIIDTTKSVEELTQAYKDNMKVQANRFMTYGDDEGNKLSDILNAYKNFQEGSAAERATLLTPAVSYEKVLNAYGKDTVEKDLQNSLNKSADELKKVVFMSINSVTDAFEYGRISATARLLQNAGFDTKDITEENMAAIRETILSALKALDDDTSQMTSSITTSIQTMLHGYSEYLDMDADSMDLVNKFVQSIDESFIKANKLADETMLRKFVSDFVKSISDESSVVSKSLAQIFAPEATANQIQDSLRTLGKEFNVDSNTLATMLGVDEILQTYVNLEKVIDEAINNIFSNNGKEWNLSERNSLYKQIKEFVAEQSIDTQDEIAKFVKALEQANYDLEEAFAIYATVSPPEVKPFNFVDHTETIDNFQDKLSSLGDMYSTVLNGDYSDNEMLDILQELAAEGADLEAIDSIEDLQDTILDLNAENIENLIDTLGIEPDSSLADYLRNVANEAIKVESALEGVTGALSNIQDGYSTVANAIKEYNKNGFLTIDTLNKILTLEPEYLACLRDENGQLELNEEAYIRLAKAQIEKARQAVVDEAMVKFNELAHDNLKESVDDATESEGSFIDKIKEGIGKLKDYATNLWGVISSKLGLNTANIVSEQTSMLINGDDLTNEQKSKLNEAYEKAAAINEQAAKEIFSDLDFKLEMINGFEANIGKSLKAGGSGSGEDDKKALETYDWYATSIERLEREISKFDDTINDDTKTLKEREKALTKQIELTEDLRDAYGDAVDAYLDEFEDIKLPKEYIEKIKNGTFYGEAEIERLDPNDADDASLIEKIEEAMPWYEKYLDAKDNEIETEQKLAELRKTNLEDDLNLETFDWIEPLLDNAEKKIQKFTDIVDDAYATFDERNQALKDSIQTTTESIETQQQAIDMYMERALGDSVKAYKALEKLGRGGNVDLSLRPQINTAELNKKGWDAGDGVATVYTSTYTNQDETVAVNFTPIIVDPITGEYIGVLSPSELQSYAEAVIDGTRTDDLNLQIGTKFTGKNAIQQAENAAIKIHEIHEEYMDLFQYIPLIQNGALDMSLFDPDNEYDKKIIEFIENYQENYDKVQTIQEEMEANQQALRQKAEQQFNLEAAKYETQLAPLEHEAELIRDLIEDTERNGGDVDPLFAQLREILNNIANLKLNHASVLQTLLDKSGVKEGTEAWQQLQDVINGITLEADENEDEIFQTHLDEFEKIIAEYDRSLSNYEHEAALIENNLAKAEARGYIANAKYYEQLMNNQLGMMEQNYAKRETLEKELQAIQAEYPDFENSIVWQEKNAEIQATTLAIAEGELALIDYANAIRQIEWDVFDFIQEQISQITNEADFLISLMERKDQYDDKGQLTDVGMATMGMHGLNYYSYVKDAERYAEELARIEADIAKNGENVDTTLINRKNELTEAYRDSILAAEDSKYAIIDMVEEGINLELESLQELIDAYEEALDSQKDLYDFQKKTANQTKNIASLQKQLAAYENDKSEEARAKIQQIRVQLEEAQSDLDDSMYEHSIDEQKELLTSLYESYEDVLNQRLDNVDQLFAEMINDINANSLNIATTITEETGKVGTTISNNMLDIWNGTQDNLSAGVSSVVGAISDSYSSMETGLQTDMDSILDRLLEGNEFDKNQSVIDGQESENRQTSLSSIVAGVHSIDENITHHRTYVEGSWERLLFTLEIIANKVIEIFKLVDAGGFSGGTSNDVTTPVETPSSSGSNSGGTSGNNSGNNSGSGKKYPSVGSEVTATGTWYEASDGTGDTGNVKLNGATSWEVEKINKGSKYPYHLISYNSKGKRVGSGWVKLSQLSGYRVGTRRIDEDEYAWTQERGQEAIIRPSDGAILTPLAQYDSVLNAGATQNLWDVANNPGQFVKDNMAIAASGSYAKTIAASGGTVETSMEVQFVLPNVTNYNEFVSQMQRDKKFEKMVQDMTINQLSGGTQMAKYRHKFV